MKSTRQCVLILFAIALVGSCSTLAGAIGLEARFDAFHRTVQQAASQPQIAQESLVRAEFERQFGDAYTDDALANMANDDLVLLLRAAESMSFYSYSASDFALIERALAALERRGAATDADRAIRFRALVGLRRFDDAGRYRAIHGTMDVEVIPETSEAKVSPAGPTVHEASSTSATLTKQTLAVADGVRLIVVSHPLCAFSREAMETLSNDAELRDIIRTRAIWLAPVQRRLYFDTLQSWNREHPSTPVVLADRREDWPFIRIWSTPTFYVLKDGQLVGFFEGWPKGVGRRPQLVTLLRAAGIDVE